MKALSLAAMGLLISGTVAAHASTIAPGFNSGSLPPNDDSSTSAQALGFTVNFFGSNQSSAYVNNNGNLTFNAALAFGTPLNGFTATYNLTPIIAPFWADVDTRAVGTVTYGQGTYAGHAAFGVTWTLVGYYSSNSDKVDTFQEILVSRSGLGAGDFDIYFNYGQIQWEAGDLSGGIDGLGGISAAVGFASGTGAPNTYYQLPGSGVPGTFIDTGTAPLITGTNDGVPGQQEFSFRDGFYAVPEPATLSVLGLSVAGLLAARRRR